MSPVFIFQIKGAKKDKIFNFLQGFICVIAGMIFGVMDMIFGMFSETYARLLKSITSNFFSRYSKSYQKLLKTQQTLTKRWAALGLPNCMYLIQLNFSLEWS